MNCGKDNNHHNNNRFIVLLALLLMALSLCFSSGVHAIGRNGITTKIASTTTSHSFNMKMTTNGGVQREAISLSDHHDGHHDDHNQHPIPFVDSRVSVQIPFELHNPNGYEHVKASFGFTKSRGSIYGDVYFIDGGHLCDPITLLNGTGPNHTAIAPWTVYPTPKDALKPVETPFIIMARYSNVCSPVTQVRHGQAIGASAMLLGQEHCRCGDMTCITKFGNDGCLQVNKSSLLNDGSAGDITIPSFLLYHHESWEVIDHIKNQNKNVLIELAWGLKPSVQAAADNVYLHEPIEYSLVTTPYDPIVKHNLLYDMKLLSSVFTPEQAVFRPRYYILDGARYDCIHTENVNNTGPCDHLCTNHGRYCLPHASDLSGHAIVRETLRQFCIWNHYGSYDADMKDVTSEEKQHHEIYWDYVIYHRAHCSHPDEFANTDCIYDSYIYAEIPTDSHTKTAPIIDECMLNSGNIEDDVVNSVLEFHMKKQQEHGIVTVPSMLVNDYILQETNIDTLFYSICEYYQTTPLHDDTLYPVICDTCSYCPYLAGCLEHKKCMTYPNHNEYQHEEQEQEKEEEEKMKKNKNGRKHKGHSWFWSFFLFITVCGGGFLYAYYKQNNDSLPFLQNTGRLFGSTTNQQDRTGLLNNYFQLSSTE